MNLQLRRARLALDHDLVGLYRLLGAVGVVLVGGRALVHPPACLRDRRHLHLEGDRTRPAGLQVAQVPGDTRNGARLRIVGVGAVLNQLYGVFWKLELVRILNGSAISNVGQARILVRHVVHNLHAPRHNLRRVAHNEPVGNHVGRGHGLGFLSELGARLNLLPLLDCERRQCVGELVDRCKNGHRRGRVFKDSRLGLPFHRATRRSHRLPTRERCRVKSLLAHPVMSSLGQPIDAQALSGSKFARGCAHGSVLRSISELHGLRLPDRSVSIDHNIFIGAGLRGGCRRAVRALLFVPQLYQEGELRSKLGLGRCKLIGSHGLLGKGKAHDVGVDLHLIGGRWLFGVVFVGCFAHVRPRYRLGNRGNLGLKSHGLRRPRIQGTHIPSDTRNALRRILGVLVCQAHRVGSHPIGSPHHPSAIGHVLQGWRSCGNIIGHHHGVQVHL